MGRKRLNTGDVSIPGSGDTIHDGGNKIHDNTTELYQAFGDRRLENVPRPGTDEEWITPHATGYFQHRPLAEYASSVASGSMHDINSNLSAGHFPVLLPQIGQVAGRARRGERVVLQDSIGSWSTIPVRVTPSSGQAISGQLAAGYYLLNEPKMQVTFTVVSEEPGSERWDVRIEAINSRGGALVNTTQVVPNPGMARTDLHLRENYNSIKVMVYAQSRNKSLNTVTSRSVFEMHIMNTPQPQIFSTRYAAINTTSDSPVVDATPVIYTNPAGSQVVAIDFTTTEPSTQEVTVSVKSISSLRQTL